MPLSASIQAQIAFKNLLGKSQTADNKDIGNESVGISFDIPSLNVMMDAIGITPSVSVSDGLAVQITANLTVIEGSNGQSYQAFWPNNPPSGSDIRNDNKPFEYGKGSLENITGGQKLTNLISEAFGKLYQAIPKNTSGVVIGPLDDRVWVFQYNSGVFYQQFPNLGSGDPFQIDVYYYIGDRLLALSKSTQANIRVSATVSVNTDAQDIYFATYSIPMISSFSTNYLFLVDFYKTNLSSTVSFNINGIGTTSVIKYTKDGPVPLVPGDIVGATGGTVGQIYYLVYNNGLFEYYPKNPLSDASSFTNPNDTTFQLGGVDIGTQFDKVSLQDMFKDLLYPDQLGKITGFTFANNTGQVTSYEVGNSLPQQTYTFSWSLYNSTDFRDNTLKVEDYNTFGTIFTQSTSNSSPFSVGLATFSSNVPLTRTFKISLTRKNGTVVSKFLDIPWLWKVYYGSSTYSTLTASQVFNLGGNLASQSFGTWTISGTSGYKYIAFPDDVTYNFNSIDYKGLPLAIAGVSSGYSYSYADLNYLYVTVSNSYGVSKQYKIYRTKNQIGGTISVNLS